MEKLSSKLYSWASILDPQTEHQAHETAKMPFVQPHLALMPDAHLGKGATVGSVIPTVGAIIPAAVGVDIGCGMMAVRTQFTRGELPADLSPLREAIEKAVPLSAGNYNAKIRNSAVTRRHLDELAGMPGIKNARTVAPNWEFQLGSLGSGNHFIEVSLDELDRVWLFLHSGSRGVGNKLAGMHIRIAAQLRKGERLPNPDLAYLKEDEPEFGDYITDLKWAQEFAFLNRAEMMDRVLDCMTGFTGTQVSAEESIGCHHNYTESVQWIRVNDSGKTETSTVWLSRKGAIDASEGKPGLIPGSMGTASYVVEGKGNPQALWSAPHGAGRQYSRNAARKTFTMESLEEKMQGIEWRHTDAFLDEHPEAYKPIDQVMEDAKDLVSVKHTLRQILNVKGD